MLLTALIAILGCSDPAGPVELEPIYTLVSADGSALPWREYHTYEDSGCTADLRGSVITFSKFGQYEASLDTQLTCGDGQHPPSHTLSRGSYSREGDTVVLDPAVATTFTLDNVTVREAGLTAVLSTSGEQYTLVFREGF